MLRNRGITFKCDLEDSSILCYRTAVLSSPLYFFFTVIMINVMLKILIALHRRNDYFIRNDD